MRKIITLNDLILAFPAAVMYGYAYRIPDALGCNEWVCLAICLGAGIPLEMLFEHVLWHKKVQQNKIPRKAFQLACLVFYVAMNALSVFLFDDPLGEDLIEELFIWAILVPIIICAVKALINWNKARKLEKRFADGSGGISLDDESVSYIQSLDGKNEKLDALPDDAFAARTRTGIYCGEKYGKAVRFLGIPYAQAPVGALRWKAPQPLPNSEGVWSAKYFGDSAPQDSSHKLAFLANRAQSEDCLTLNVWKSLQAPDDEKLNVVVYIHGGEFCYSGSASPLCDGEEYVKSHPDALFVNFNYRLGLLGFLNAEGIEGGQNYPDAANLGLLDQIAALRWIKENIGAFGGNAESITLLGHGSGASSIVLLSVCQQAQGLFKRAVLASPSYEFIPDGGAHSDHIAQRFMELTGTKTMAELQALNTDDITEAGEALYNEGCLFAPTLDDKLLPYNVYEALQNGAAHDITFVVGMALNETTKTLLDYNSAVQDRTAESYVAATIDAAPESSIRAALEALLDNKEYETGSTREARTAFMEEWGYRLPLIALTRSIAESGGDIWAFSWEIGSEIEKFKANSIPCIATLLNTYIVAEKLGYLVNSDAKELIQTVLAKFIRGEKPDLYFEELRGFGRVDWPKATSSSLPLLEIAPASVSCTEYDTYEHEHASDELLAYRITTTSVAINYVV